MCSKLYTAVLVPIHPVVCSTCFFIVIHPLFSSLGNLTHVLILYDHVPRIANLYIANLYDLLTILYDHVLPTWTTIHACTMCSKLVYTISLLGRTLNFFFLSLWICGWPRPVSSRSAKQPGWRSLSIIVTIATIATIVCTIE